MQNGSTIKPERGISLALSGGVFLTSASVLALEITFTRILSVMFSYHYVFIVISMALLGLAGGSIFVYFRRETRLEARPLAQFAGLFSLSIPFTIIVLTMIPYIDNILPYSLLILIPFFLAGVILSQVFQLFASQSSKVYGADLLGAAAGSLLVITLLNRFGAINTSFFIGLAAAGACLFFARAGKRKAWSYTINLLVLASLFLTSLVFPNLVDIPIKNQAKELSAAFSDEPSQRGSIIETRWSSFGRTDLVQYQEDPDAMALYTDATAGSYMYNFNGDIKNPGPRIESLKVTFPGYFPFPFLEPEQKDNALIIGPGGGRDVLVALMAGVRQITAVEVNRDLVDMVKKYSSYNGGIYTNFPNVNLVVAEGRSFLRQQKDKFDIIMLSLPVTKTSRSPEGFALTENFLFTKESIQEYLDHLTAEGRLIVVTHDSLEVMKLLSMSMAALEERGIYDKAAMDYIYTVGSHTNSLFVLSKTRIKWEESYLGHKVVHLLSYHPDASYFPYIRPSINPNHLEQNRFDECQMLNPVLTAVSNGSITLNDLGQAIAEKGYDIDVVTDNRPFFYKLEEGIPTSLAWTFWLAVTFILMSILAPNAYKKGKPTSKHQRQDREETLSLNRFILLFSMLGLGFMLVEVSLIQRFTLFLGEPILSVTVLLFSLLVGAGIGGLLSSRISWSRLSRKICVITLSISLLLLVYAFLPLLILSQLLALSLPWRAVVSAVLLTPLGFLMGFPFPLGIRLLKAKELEHHIPWLWGINGTASVLGSVAAIVVAMMFGLTQALLIGAACYLAASLAFIGRTERQEAFESE